MESTTGSGVGGDRKASVLVATVTDLLSRFIQTGRLNNPLVYFEICLSLARGIDHAIANNEVPSRSHDLPLLLKQLHRCKNGISFEAAFMVLMISIKRACKIGWFTDKETDDLLILAKEAGRNFSNTEDTNFEPSYALPHTSLAMSRFFPKMKMDRILVSLEIKPGYGAFVADFHISKDMVATQREKIWLFVVRTDNMDTSSCIITPPQVNFLLNGKGVRGRVNISMDNGPQLPTDVTPMLKYGINLLQAIGQFNGNYIIVLATMNAISSSGTLELQDYDHHVVPSVDSDFEIIETSSRISLNCPISQCRIKTPVKGHLCKHLQCFDYDNFLAINSRRPSWRCPHCNQSVCHPDLRIDQNIVKVLREAGDADVIISEDGSWKPVLKNKDHSAQTHDMTQISQLGGNEQCESSSNFRNENRELSQDNHQSLSAFNNLLAPEVNTRYNCTSQTKEDFWSVVFQSISSAFCSSAAVATSLSTQKVNTIPNNLPSNLVPSAVLTDSVSPTLRREPVHAHGRTQLTTSALQNQLLSPHDMQLQHSAFGSSSATNEAGKLQSMGRLVSMTESAVQELLAKSQASSLFLMTRTKDACTPLGASSARPQIAPSMAPNMGRLDTINRCTEREQQFPGLCPNVCPVSDVASSSLQHHSVTQNSVGSDCQRISGQSVQQTFDHPPQGSGLDSGSSRHPSMERSPHHRNASNSGMTQAVNPSRNLVHSSIRVQPVQVQQKDGIQQPAWTPRTAYSLDMVAERLRAAGEQIQNVGTATEPISRGESSTAMVSDQNWRPSGRMRGSLKGEAYSAALSQFLSQPTQSSRASQPPSSPVLNLPGGLPMHGLRTSRTTASNGSQAQTPQGHNSQSSNKLGHLT